MMLAQRVKKKGKRNSVGGRWGEKVGGTAHYGNDKNF